MSDNGEAIACAGCGLVIAGGSQECEALFQEESSLHTTDVGYFAIHRLFVDAYSLQHPDTHGDSFASLASHLMHLCWSLEQGGSRAVPNEAITAWIEGHAQQDPPPIPEQRGVVTIAHVVAAANAAAHRMAVDLWAKSVWEAYRAQQPLVREWVKAAFEQQGDTRRH
jgi:hypothetical protein